MNYNSKVFGVRVNDNGIQANMMHLLLTILIPLGGVYIESAITLIVLAGENKHECSVGITPNTTRMQVAQ
jgi:hypothetical protein